MRSREKEPNIPSQEGVTFRNGTGSRKERCGSGSATYVRGKRSRQPEKTAQERTYYRVRKVSERNQNCSLHNKNGCETLEEKEEVQNCLTQVKRLLCCKKTISSYAPGSQREKRVLSSLVETTLWGRRRYTHPTGECRSGAKQKRRTKRQDVGLLRQEVTAGNDRCRRKEGEMTPR